MKKPKNTTKQQLDSLSELQNGWLDGSGFAPTPKAISAARRLLRFLPRGFIYPRPEGGIQCEWSLKNWELEIGFDSLGRIDFSGTQVKSDEK